MRRDYRRSDTREEAAKLIEARAAFNCRWRVRWIQSAVDEADERLGGQLHVGVRCLGRRGNGRALGTNGDDEAPFGVGRTNRNGALDAIAPAGPLADHLQVVDHQRGDIRWKGLVRTERDGDVP